LDWIFRVLGFLAMTAVAFSVPLFPTMELDSSWRMAIGRFLMEGRQFGHEVVFTYGPLGFAMGKTYWGDHWGLLVGWHAVQAVVFSAIVYWHAYRLTGYPRLFCFLFFFLFGLSYQDAVHQSMIALAGLELIRRSNVPWRWSSVALLVLLVVLSLVKFTNLLLAFFLVLLAGALELQRTRRLSALRVPAVFFGLFLLGWMACGQHVGNLPAYFKSSWEISQGYLDAMGFSCPPRQLYLGLTVAALVLAYLALNLATHPARLRGLALTLGALAYLYLNWKHGFIRADGHQIGFYYAVLTILATSPLLLEGTPRFLQWKIPVAVLAGVLSLISLELVLPGLVRGTLGIAQGAVDLNVQFALGKAYTRDIYEGRLEAERNNYDLPKAKAIVKRASLDVLGFEQAIALYNGFNYQPRPVFQGYSAYTPYLSQLNYEFYASDRAPEFVLFKLQTIDGRLATMDDPHALRLLTQRYAYLFSEQGFTLWQRKPGAFDAAKFDPAPLRAGVHRFGENISVADVADRNLWVEIRYHFSLLGKLRRFLFKPPLVELHITDDKGKETIHRLPEPIGRAGFMLNPVVNDMLDFMRANGGVPSRRASSIRIDTAPQDRDCLQEEVEVALFTLPPSDAGKEYFKNADKAKFHMFKDAPMSYEAHNPPNEDLIDKTPVMILHAPSQMVFEVPAGATMMQGAFGFVAGAYSNGGKTNGADFGIYWSDGNDTTALLERFLDPVTRVKDRGLQKFSVKLPQGKGHVTLKVGPGPYGEFAFDWTGWTGIEFK
ncbi:MAG: hypothetical protein JWQ62_2411, partial [Lacunisphaera sp.]|nr:hypothetical protein [Lacunisphaera sp.]